MIPIPHMTYMLGIIADIVKASEDEILSSQLDAGGRLALPGLVDGHVHLDKCYLLDRCQALTGDFKEAMDQTLHAKQHFTKKDITRRNNDLINCYDY